MAVDMAAGTAGWAEAATVHNSPALAADRNQASRQRAVVVVPVLQAESAVVAVLQIPLALLAQEEAAAQDDQLD